MDSVSRAAVALEQMEFARGYTKMFLEDLTPEEWFWQPPEPVTHVAWQVGHLAIAQFGLVCLRMRGEQPGDEEIIPREYRKMFGKGSTATDAADCPTPEDLLATLDRVHQEVVALVPTLTADTLAEPVDPGHPIFKTKLSTLSFTPQHEMIHAGQIALLRRLMGKAPLR
jgi:hypothetical protein